MLDLNNYVATSVSWPQLYYVIPGLKPAKNARKIYFPNRTWIRKASTVKSFCWRRMAVQLRRAPERARKIKPRSGVWSVCVSDLEPTIQSTTSPWSAVNLKKKTAELDKVQLEPAIWSRDTGQRIPCFGRCQLTIRLMSNIKDVCCKLATVSNGQSWKTTAQVTDRGKKRRLKGALIRKDHFFAGKWQPLIKFKK